MNNSKHVWNENFAPPVSETICPSCPISEGLERNEIDDESYEYDYEEVLEYIEEKLEMMKLLIIFTLFKISTHPLSLNCLKSDILKLLFYKFTP